MKDIVTNSVAPAPLRGTGGTGRAGTCIATRAQLLAALGEPHYVSYGDYSVTTEWEFFTPRGMTSLHDYWWNASDEWSIAASNHKAAMWLAAYLRTFGFRARPGATYKDLKGTSPSPIHTGGTK